MAFTAVVDASTLIALHQIDKLGLLPQLFSSIYAPPAVFQEIQTVRPQPSWLRTERLQQPLSAIALQSSLGAGESEVIGLALEMNTTESSTIVVVLDDLSARRVAENLGLFVVGTLGLLLLSKNRGLIPALRPMLDALRVQDFRIADSLYEQVLRDCKEW